MSYDEIDFGRNTDVGRSRPVNEDTIRNFPDVAYEEKGGRLFIVADGVGGESFGEVASKLGADTASEAFYEFMAENPQSMPEQGLLHALKEANKAVHAAAWERLAAGHMATTLVCAVLRKNELSVAWVGDSRAYILRSGSHTLEQISFDHSFVGDRVRAGVMTPEEAAVHPRRNVLTRSIGGRPEVEADVVVGKVKPGDILLLCSDGLTRHLNDDEIAKYLLTTTKSQFVADHLIKKANERGGMDNISVVVVYIGSRKDTDVDILDLDTNVGFVRGQNRLQDAGVSMLMKRPELPQQPTNPIADADTLPTSEPDLPKPAQKQNPFILPATIQGFDTRILVGVLTFLSVLAIVLLVLVLTR